jgi:hypothetical protein
MPTGSRNVGSRARIDFRTKENSIPSCLWKVSVSQSAVPNPNAATDRLEAATDLAIEACGGDARQAVTAGDV